MAHVPKVEQYSRLERRKIIGCASTWRVCRTTVASGQIIYGQRLLAKMIAKDPQCYLALATIACSAARSRERRRCLANRAIETRLLEPVRAALKRNAVSSEVMDAILVDDHAGLVSINQ